MLLRTSRPTTVILSGAPSKFVVGQDQWRAVEGSRACVLCYADSGNSHQNAVPTPCGSGGSSSLRVSSTLRLDICRARSRTSARCYRDKAREETPYISMARDNLSGSFDSAPNHFRTAEARRGAALRMTEAIGLYGAIDTRRWWRTTAM